ncbi:hypothetical protein COOONC_20591 [Cooperia oncophora]
MLFVEFKVTNAIYANTTHISTYSICPDLQCDFSQIGRTEFDIENVGPFVVDVIDSVKDYVELMQKIFDFGKVCFFTLCSTSLSKELWGGSVVLYKARSTGD